MTKLDRLKSLFWLRWHYLMANKVLLYLCIGIPIGYFLPVSFIPQYQGKLLFLTFVLNFIYSMTSGCFVSIMVSEEKEKKNLRTLILAGVTLKEYIISIIMFPLILSIGSCLIFPFLIRVSLPNWPLYLFIAIGTCVIFILANLSIALFTKNQTQATLFGFGITMIALVLAMLPEFVQNTYLSHLISLSFVGANTNIFMNSGHLALTDISILAMLVWIVGLLILTRYAFIWNRKNHA